MDIMDNVAPIVVVGFIILVIFAIILRLRDQKTKNELRQRGVTVTAHVTARLHDVQTRTDENNNTTTTNTYYVTYLYTANGTSHSRREIVGPNTYEILREGQPVEVVYLPENPGQARLASSL